MAAIIARLGLVRTSASWRHAFKPAAGTALKRSVQACGRHTLKPKLSPACGLLPSLRGAAAHAHPCARGTCTSLCDAATWQSSASRCGQHACRKSKAFTGLRPARSFSRRKRTPNALRRARVVSAPASPIRCASWQPQAGAELTRPCARSLRDPARVARYAFTSSLRDSLGQTAAPFPCGCLRCSPRFTARCRTRPAHPCATCLLFRFIPPHHARVPGCTAGAVNPRVSALRPQPGLRQPVIL